jgi:hypothetical protein
VPALLGPQDDEEPVDLSMVEFFLRDGHGWITSLRIAREVRKPHRS